MSRLTCDARLHTLSLTLPLELHPCMRGKVASYLDWVVCGPCNDVVLEGQHEDHAPVLGLGDDHPILRGSIEVRERDVCARGSLHRRLCTGQARSSGGKQQLPLSRQAPTAIMDLIQFSYCVAFLFCTSQMLAPDPDSRAF